MKYEAPAKRQRVLAEEKLLCAADPCQSRATRLAKESPVLVIHGPPGTGKSQTISNIIGDHLSRGERVLMVCDKRTALDVVYNRLTHLGIGDLCAIVHDPQRDQRTLYMKLRDYLDTLAERGTNAGAEAQLTAVDGELQKLHLELSGYFNALAEAPKPGQSTFHNLVGDWLGLEGGNGSGYTIDEGYLAQAHLGDLDSAKSAIAETFDRGIAVEYPKNPWATAAGLELGEFLTRPLSDIRGSLEKLIPLAETLDKSADESLPPLAVGDLPAQAKTRRRLAGLLLEFEPQATPDIRKTWYSKAPEVLKQTLSAVQGLDLHVAAISTAPLDVEIAAVVATKSLSVTEINAWQADLENYNATAESWHAFIHRKKKAAADEVAKKFGLHISSQTGKRLFAFLTGLKSRALCQDFLTSNQLRAASGLVKDAELLETLSKFKKTIETILELKEKADESVAALFATSMGEPLGGLAEKLSKSAERAIHLHELLTAMDSTRLFSHTWVSETTAAWRAGKTALQLVNELIAKLPTLEVVLRMRLAFQQIPEGLRNPVAVLIYQSADSDAGIKALRFALLTKEISARIRSNPFLQQVDQERMEKCFQRYRELESQKFGLVRNTILNRWVGLQKSRLLARTGTQLNSLGASLKRRLVTRGERAMKLRQVILQGANGADRDPLFDICPVWMASPATVAQIFPRLPLFDAIVFDEASQCRLEEALPVLLRGKRIVIAGDPKQLPPTRFFETALAESEVSEADSEQDLFEQQQSETEDLLGAALNTAVQQSYLDVHYRSHDEALIGFSNRNFYQNRLQAIPCHPSRKKSIALELIRADGTYEERANKKEARLVCDIVSKLLVAHDRPSIGVACFNLTQRDVILDTLQERCEQDRDFEERLEEARKRKGSASFEGLFVKNLENVQGDERDHIIISTTFGPDKAGRFRRGFGPLSQAGGGRRLNVLITRAREMVHVVTSIPTSEYRALPPVEQDQTPNGRWLLYAYLAYIENLQKVDQRSREEKRQESAVVTIDKTEYASPLSVNVAHLLATSHQLSARVPWGTPGFCIDLFVRRPGQADDAGLGVLCDMSRFQQASDPVEWELFRTAALERQGWKLHRLWSPTIFTNSNLHLARVAESIQAEGEPAAVKSESRVA
ncbi:MAG TPA: AAA domain-containing protein, partial [Verrucomicrobiae bacterium]|nr:AAA domain-containing protein [Verrucomicrobiae bacterium]